MRIISPYKDYYDYVEFLYSPQGGDTNLVYSRRDLPDKVEIDTKNKTPDAGYFFSRVFKRTEFENKYQFDWVAIAGDLYLVANGKILKEDDPIFQDVQKALKEVRYRPYGWKQENNFEAQHKLTTWSPKVDAVAKQIQSPVFLIRARTWSDNSQFVPKEIPNLGRLGLASLVPAEQMYQTLSMYVANVLRDNPDNTLPATVSDKDRLVQKGFDPKTSFRGKTPK